MSKRKRSETDVRIIRVELGAKKPIEGSRVTSDMYSQIIAGESVDVVDAHSGDLIVAFRHNVMSADAIGVGRSSYGNIDAMMKPSFTRGAAAGVEPDLDAMRAFDPRVVKMKPLDRKGKFALTLDNGTELKKPHSNPVKSFMAGYNFWRFKGGVKKTTGFTKSFPEEWKRSLPFFNGIGAVFAQEMPEVYSRMAAHCANFRDYCIGDTNLSTVAINVNYNSKVHLDRGDIDDGLSTLTVLEFGEYRGGLFVLPAYKIAFDVRQGDVLFTQSHRHWHGNTDIEPLEDGARRISFVTYLKKRLVVA